jgi:hypothetical protein
MSNLSHLLASKGLAPHINNLIGKLQFTSQTIQETQQDLDDAGISLPAFGNIESALQKELKEPTEEESTLFIYLLTLTLERQNFLKSKKKEIIRAQAYSRGYIQRRKFNALKQFYRQREPQVIKIQAAWKGHLQRLKYKNRIVQLKSEENLIVKLQANRRAKVAREKFVERKQFFKKNEPSVVKIQATWRAKKMEKGYKAISTYNNPSVKILQEFLHLLDDTDHDYDEELGTTTFQH